MQSQIRAFIAIDLPSEVKALLQEIQLRLKQPGNDYVKWVDPVNIHLTLKFFANLSTSRLPLVYSAVKSAASTVQPFHLTFEGAGAFPDLNRVQVIWVGLKGDTGILSGLQKDLDSRLAEAGFPAETRPFSPHLTLGRVRETAAFSFRQTLGKSITSLKIEDNIVFDIKSLKLMQSRLFPTGPVYTCLNSVDF